MGKHFAIILALFFSKAAGAREVGIITDIAGTWSVDGGSAVGKGQTVQAGWRIQSRAEPKIVPSIKIYYYTKRAEAPYPCCRVDIPNETAPGLNQRVWDTFLDWLRRHPKSYDSTISKISGPLTNPTLAGLKWDIPNMLTFQQLTQMSTNNELVVGVSKDVWNLSGLCSDGAAKGIVPSAALQRRMALVVGNSNYKEAPLQNATNDAKALGNSLQALGFDVTVAFDTTGEQLRTATNKFASGLTPQDLAVFYYSGHGTQVNGENYLIPVDSAAASAEQLRTQGVQVGQIQDRLLRAGSRVMILDTARSRPGTNTDPIWMNSSLHNGTLLAYATANGSADTGSQNESLFTKYLIDSLKTPGSSLKQALESSSTRVARSTNNRQASAVVDKLPGDLALTNEPLRFSVQLALDTPTVKGPWQQEIQANTCADMRLRGAGKSPGPGLYTIKYSERSAPTPIIVAPESKEKSVEESMKPVTDLMQAIRKAVSEDAASAFFAYWLQTTLAQDAR